ncbi:MAG: HNH endonuclease signature motif containing protein [Candidatus Eremiobacteraeota bacterium]|nr:HNH endonuclease signature motif containing protein [Candidatus Eremiobacteraeota bacterium]
MDTFELSTTHSIFLPDEEELLHLGNSISSKDCEDLLLLPEPYELPAEARDRAERLVKISRDGLLPEAEKLTDNLTLGPALIDRDERASLIDFTLCKAIRGRLALDLVLGGLLVNLKMKGVDHLGYRSIATFAAEHLSMSGRTASELMHNYMLLESLPLTREAYLQGKVAKSALRHLSRVITPESEASWIKETAHLSMSALERKVGEVCAGKDPAAQAFPAEDAQAPDGGENEGVMMYFRVSPTLALTWDFALSLFRDKEHYDGPVAGFVEAILANWAASGKFACGPAALDEKGSLPVFYKSREAGKDSRPGTESVTGPAQAEAFPGDTGSTAPEAEISPWEMPWDIFFPSWLEETRRGGKPGSGSVRAVAERLIRAASMRQRLEVAIGMLLRAMHSRQLFTNFGFESIEEYAQTRCGLSRTQARQFITVANGFRRHSLTEKAFKNGTITREQARLILPLVNGKNEEAWIEYAASVPTADLREEAERIARIIEYDSFAAVNYTLLPGFRYISDERSHELPFEVRDAIRTGSWYGGPSQPPVWPLSEDDEELMEARDRRFDEPWKHFSDVDEMLAAEATIKVEKNSALCASLKEARDICTIPSGANPEETFLVDIIQGGSPSPSGRGTMTIRFSLPEELFEIWSTAARAFLHLTAQAEAAGVEDTAIPPVETFLAALLADYLATEGHFQKAAHHHRILKRDRFRCQSPGCRCRRNLHVHHLIRRSQGGTDDPWNLITLCEACHLHLIHGLRTLTIRGRAPFELTVTFGASSESEPFLVYDKGVKTSRKHL